MRNRILAIALAIIPYWFFLPATLTADEPTPGAARISLIHGDVSTMRGDTGQWAATTVNAPLVQGDAVSTGERSRTEIQLDFADILRLDQSTEAKIADLTQAHIQIQVASGRINFAVLNGAQAPADIDTPNMSVHPLAFGVYRIQVNSPSETQLTVRDGRAEVSTQQGVATVEKDQTIFIRGTDNPEYQILPAEARDEWDDWNRSRDSAIESAQSWAHTNPYYTGTQDLDQNGVWTETPDYGEVWEPNVNPDWVPYSDGSWEWEPYWGWTWVSYEPWGWAPYHFGRWVFWGNRWGWWPGPVTLGFRPAWGPAWVSFIGFGFGGVGFGFGRIGWMPLGPHDPFSPWWGRGNGYNAVGIAEFARGGGIGPRFGTNLQAALTNPRLRSAITVVAANQFGNGRVAARGMALDSAGLRQARLIQGTVPVAPTVQSLRAVAQPVSRAALPSGVISSQHFFSREAAPAGPAPFHEQAAQVQRMIQTHGSLGAGATSTNRLGAAATARSFSTQPQSSPAARQASGGVRSAGGGDWRGFASSQPARGASVPAQSNYEGRYTSTAPMGGSSPRTYQASPQAGGRPAYSQPSPGWSRFATQPRVAAPSRYGGWSAPAPSGGRSYQAAPGGGYGRPPLQLNRPIVTQRAPTPRSSESSGGHHGGSGSSGGGRSAPAPSSGGHSGGGGGSHRR